MRPFLWICSINLKTPKYGSHRSHEYVVCSRKHCCIALLRSCDGLLASKAPSCGMDQIPRG